MAVFTVLMLLVMVGGGILWVWMIVDCATKEPSEGNDKLVWILIILLTYVIGALIYFLVRRPTNPAIRTLKGQKMKHHAFAAQVTLGLLLCFSCMHKTTAEEAARRPAPRLRDLFLCGVVQVGTNVVVSLENTKDHSYYLVSPGQATPDGLWIQEAWPFDGAVLVREGGLPYVICMAKSVAKPSSSAASAYGGLARRVPLSFIKHVQSLLSAESGKPPAEVRRVSSCASFNTRGPVTREVFSSVIESVLQKEGSDIDLLQEDITAMQDDLNDLHGNLMAAAGSDAQRRAQVEEVARMPPDDATIQNLPSALAELNAIVADQLNKRNRYEELSPAAGAPPVGGGSRTYSERRELRKEMLRKRAEAVSEGSEMGSTNKPASPR